MSKYLKMAEKARRKSRFANESVERIAVNNANSSKKPSVREARTSLTPPTYLATKATEATEALGRRVVSGSAPATKATKAEDDSTTAGFVVLTVGEALQEINRRDSGPAKNAELYRRGELSREKAIEYTTCAILYRRGEPFEGWRRHAPAVEVVLTDPQGCECEECS